MALSSRTYRRMLACAAAIAVSAGASGAFAGNFSLHGVTVESSPIPTKVVRYDDLNLSTTSGQSTLYRRIASAARDVCPDTFTRDLTLAAAARGCQSQAIAQALQDVHKGQLALVHGPQTNRAQKDPS